MKVVNLVTSPPLTSLSTKVHLLLWSLSCLSLSGCQKIISVGGGDFQDEGEGLSSGSELIDLNLDPAVADQLTLGGEQLVAGGSMLGGEPLSAGVPSGADDPMALGGVEVAGALPPPICEPINGAPVDERCLPTCEEAGGDSCAPVGSTLCDFVPLIESSDCALCCARPSPPRLRPQSFHTVIIQDTYTWDRILELSERGLGAMISSQDKPDQVPFERWAQNISWQSASSGYELAGLTHSLLGDPEGSPAYVLIAELNSRSIDVIEELARDMLARYPQWRGRWGVYLTPGDGVSYENLSAPIDALLEAGATLIPEMYYSRASYCASGASTEDRDSWLERMFRGDDSLARMDWLTERVRALGSSSRVTPVFGVNDRFLEGSTAAAYYLDRMFYVWVKRSGHAELISPAQGGVGAWKWDASVVTNTSRDLAFVQSFEHYLVNRADSSRLGEVSCP